MTAVNEPLFRVINGNEEPSDEQIAALARLLVAQVERGNVPEQRKEVKKP